jgi:hypothetical protein
LLLVLAACYARAGERGFTSPDGTFQLAYPDAFRLYAGAQLDSPDSLACTAPPSLTALACVRYAAGKFKRTTFDDAAVRVAIVPAENESKCLNYSDWQFAEDVKTTAVNLNGVAFRKAEMGGASRGHTLQESLFRTFRGSQCYELDMVIAYGDESDGERRVFTKDDARKVARALQAVVDSFRFLK